MKIGIDPGLFNFLSSNFLAEDLRSIIETDSFYKPIRRKFELSGGGSRLDIELSWRN
jgi:hypothetical protein